MPATYEPIATQTLGTAAASIDFTSIPATYTDLRVVLVCTVSTADPLLVRFNSDSGANYSRTVLAGDGSTADSLRQTSTNQIFITRVSRSTTIPAMNTIDVFSYAGSTNKTALITDVADKNGSGVVANIVGLWRNTAAITSINLSTLSAYNFNIGTTATLYGIKNA